MCGIVGYIGKEEKTIKVLIEGLEHLEYRGYDSSGIAYIENNNLIIKKEPGRISNLKNKLDMSIKTNIGIGHTRWATHGKANKINSHPHKYKDITIVHNGIIENYLELKKELLNKGYKFISETDTEVACVLLYDLYKDDLDILNSIKKFKKKVIGSYAIAIICKNDINSLYVIKNNSPLIIGIGKSENFISSDIWAIIDYTHKYITLDDGNYAKITKDKVLVYDNNNKEKKIEIKEYQGNITITSKLGYEHYMLKEINEEPEVIKNNINNSKLIDISKYKKIVLVGCGSAMHASMVGSYFIEKYLNIPTQVEIASEFRYKKLFIDEDTLVIAISQSGETADTLEAVKIAKKYSATTLGIINVFESSIAREVDNVIYTNAGTEVSVATTKAYLAQVEILSLLVYHSIKNKRLNELINYKDELTKLPIIISNLINSCDLYQTLANKIYKEKNIFFIGRSIDYAIGMEGSLKLKEISYIHSEAYPAGELKHGTISLIEKNTPVIGIVTDSSIADKTISNLKEVKARGAYVILLTTNALVKPGDFYDELIKVPTTNNLLQPLINIIPLQLLAYYVAKLNKCDIDKPKNLAKSVTVE